MTHSQDDPVVDAGVLAAQSAELAASNESLSARIQSLSDSLTRKAEQTEVTRTKKTAWWSVALNVAHIAAFAIAFFFGLGFVHAQGATERLAQCINKQFQIQQDNTTLLRDASAKERAAQRTFIDAIATGSDTDKRKAFLTYQAGLHDADAQRTTVQPVQKCH